MRCFVLALTATFCFALVSCSGTGGFSAELPSAEGLTMSVTRESSDWEPPTGILLEVPVELQVEFEEVYGFLEVQNKTTLYVMDSQSSDHRRAMCYYMFGLYQDIYFDQLLLVMFASPQGTYTQLATAIATANGAVIASECYAAGREVYCLAWDVEKTRQQLADTGNSIIQSYGESVGQCAATGWGCYDSSPDEEYVKYKPGYCYAPFKISAPEAWETTKGKDGCGEPVLIALFDCGIFPDHEDFNGHGGEKSYLNIGSPTVRVNWTDRTGEDYDAPWEMQPLDPSNPAGGDDPYIGSGHGTAITGIIAALDHLDGTGTVGIAPEAKVVPFRISALEPGPDDFKFLQAAATCADANAGAGLNYAIKAANCSFHYAVRLPAVELAVTELVVSNILVICTDTGNLWQGHRVFPGALNYIDDDWPYGSAILAVSRLDFNDTFTDIELSWDWTKTDVFAPSQWHLLAIPTLEPESVGGYSAVNGDGVSFGIPVVAGVAALISASGRAANPVEIKQVILDNARPLLNVPLNPLTQQYYTEIDAAFLSPMASLFESGIDHREDSSFCAFGEMSLGFGDYNGSGPLRIEVFSKDPGWRWEELEPWLGCTRTTTPYRMLDDRLRALGIWYWEEYIYPYGWFQRYEFDEQERSIAGAWSRTYEGVVFSESPFSNDFYPPRKPTSIATYENGGAILLADRREASAIYNPKPAFLLGYGVDVPLDINDLISGEVIQLTKGTESDSMLMITREATMQGLLYRVVRFEPGNPPMIEILYTSNDVEALVGTTNVLWAVGSIGSQSGCAWLDPADADHAFNVAYYDESAGVLHWSSQDLDPAQDYYTTVDLEAPFLEPIESISLTGNSNNLPYLVVTCKEEIDAGNDLWRWIVEGVRVGWITTYDPEKTGAAKELLILKEDQQYDYGVCSRYRDFTCQISPEDIMDVVYLFDTYTSVTPRYSLKTLDYE